MPSLTLPSLNAPGQPVSPSATHGRAAGQSQGRSFGAVLDHSRVARTPNTKEPVDAAVLEPTTGRKPPLTGDEKEELAADLSNMALFGAAPASVNPPPVAAQTAAQDGNAAGLTVTKGAPDTAQGPLARGMVQKAVALASQDAPTEAKVATSARDASRAEAVALPAASRTPLPLSPGATPATAGAPSAQATSSAAGAVSSILERAGSPQAAKPFDALKRVQDSSAANADPLAAPAIQQPLMSAATDRPDTLAAHPPVLWVAPVVGSGEWGSAIGQQMLHMNANGHHVAELSLNPSGLGPLKVTLTLGDSQAQAIFVSAHESVRKAVEAALPQLRTTLAEQGISLGQTSVGAETRQPAGQGGASAQQNPSKPSHQPGHPGSSRFDTVAIAQPLPGAQTSVLHRAGSGLDTFA